MVDPHRFRDDARPGRSLTLVFIGSLVVGIVLAAVPRETSGFAIATVLAGSWLSLVLAVTLPSPSERAGAELSRRLALFRDALNAVGDSPTTGDLQRLIARAGELGLREDEVAEELLQIRASLEAVALRERLAGGHLPTVPSDAAPGDVCRYVSAARFGRRKSDQVGQLMLTDNWLTFRGAIDVSIAWTEVSILQRAGCALIVSLHDSRRLLRFECPTLDDAARAGVIAEFLARSAQRREAGDAPVYQPAV